MKDLFTLNTDANNYVLSISHTNNDNIELDLSSIDLTYLNAYQYLGGELVLDEVKKQTMIDEQIKQSKAQAINKLKNELANYDYIGVKIAMGVATKEDYVNEIAYTETLRQKIRELEGK